MLSLLVYAAIQDGNIFQFGAQLADEGFDFLTASYSQSVVSTRIVFANGHPNLLSYCFVANVWDQRRERHARVCLHPMVSCVPCACNDHPLFYEFLSLGEKTCCNLVFNIFLRSIRKSSNLSISQSD